MSEQLVFIKSIAEGATEAYRETGVFASVTIAQAILESGWGKSGLAQKANNYFGIKCSEGWDGEACRMPTKEVVMGRTIVVMAAFRKYPDRSGSIRDHAAFLTKNKRYKPAFEAKDGYEFARAIAKAGYATDPLYHVKLTDIIKRYNLVQYDIL